jgi:hypothetical protein
MRTCRRFDTIRSRLRALHARPVRFAYRDAATDLVADAPVVELDVSGAPWLSD